MSRLAFKDLPPHRKALRKASMARYDRTRKGFLCRLYKNMRGRTEGIQSKKAHIYEGLYLLPRSEFYAWALVDPQFNALFTAWELSEYDQKLTPSIDRKDTKIGYSLQNIRFVTHSKNSQDGANSRWQNH